MSDDFNLNIEGKEINQKPLGPVARVFYFIPRKLRIVAAIALVAVFCIWMLNAFKPQAEKRPIPETVVRVDAVEAVPSSYPIVVTANGTVEAETRGNLVAQVRGEIVATADSFKTGGSFKKGEVLVEIDQRDYQAELSRALANLSEAEANYRREQASAKQAELDWKRLGNNTPAPDLVLRKPQLTAAKAQYDSARAAHDTAKLNLSRTQITAPYDGRIIQRNAVLGQYVGIGTPIAEVYQAGGVEVRLPISQEEYSQLGLDLFGNDEQPDFKVLLTTTVGGRDYYWDASISRTDSTFDINTRQIDVIAEVVDPFSQETDQPPLKIGQFVTAKISGRNVENAYVIPNRSIREGSYVYTIVDGKLSKQSISILWQDDENALIASGVSSGDLVVTTSLNSTLAGATAKLPDSFSPNTIATPDAPSQDDNQDGDQPNQAGEKAKARSAEPSATQPPSTQASSPSGE